MFSLTKEYTMDTLSLVVAKVIYDFSHFLKLMLEMLRAFMTIMS